MEITIYRGSNRNKNIEVLYWTTNKLVAQLYGDNVISKKLNLENYFICDFGGYEYNEAPYIVDQLENLLYLSNKYDRDGYIKIYDTSYDFPAKCDGVIIQNIVDTPDGRVDCDDEFSCEFDFLMEKYMGATVIIPENGKK